MTTSALVLFSGGQDSTTCLAWALARFDRVETVGFDYGQRHRSELDARPGLLAALRALPHGMRLGDDHLLPLDTLGAALSTNTHFPQGCNVGFARLLDRARIRLRVWERGAGATLACGSGACAAVAILRRRGKLDGAVDVELSGGTLQVQWDGEGAPVWMRGSAQFVFEGEIEI